MAPSWWGCRVVTASKRCGIRRARFGAVVPCPCRCSTALIGQVFRNLVRAAVADDPEWMVRVALLGELFAEPRRGSVGD